MEAIPREIRQATAVSSEAGYGWLGLGWLQSVSETTLDLIHSLRGQGLLEGPVLGMSGRTEDDS